MALSTNKLLAGIAQCTIDGTAYDLVNCKYDATVMTKEPLVGMDGYHGFSQKWKVGIIDVTLRDNGAISVADFQNLTEATVQLYLANGKVIVGNGMFVTDAVEVDPENGTFALKFQGPDVYESV